ncbi:MAG: hypothetical protein E5W98_00345 [Mesorhizobium sp.]|nr:MAG: hypothetical protein EOS62_04315 [Mesorhizobium sp.]TKD48651.1 MAG: hypothetical protein E5W98_00345 [Mesorhizobium sp.]
MLICSDPSRPPLSCRTSPPLGGRSSVIAAFVNCLSCRIERSGQAANLPPCGEMSGRTEGAPRSAIKGSAPS